VVADLMFEQRLDKPNWVIVDHHTTEFSPKYAQLIHDVNKSAGCFVTSFVSSTNSAPHGSTVSFS